MPDLYPYQVTGASFLAERRNALLADEMGLGKTPQAIRACDDVDAGHVLVVCPAVARVNWAREFLRWQDVLRAPVVVEKLSEAPTFRPGGSVVICSYEAISDPDAFERFRAFDFHALIIDEVHFAKNRKARRTKALYGGKLWEVDFGERRMVADYGDGLVARTRRTYALSGTPAPNQPAELYPLLNALYPEAITRPGGKRMDYWDFIRRYCHGYDHGHGVKITGGKNLDELERKMKPFMVRRMRRQVRDDVPPVRHESVAIRSQQAAKALRELEEMESGPVGDRIREALERGGAGALDTLSGDAIARLRYLTGMAKAPALVELIMNDLDIGLDKIVVFAHHTDVIKFITHGLRKYGARSLYGATPSKQRQDAIDGFQADPERRVFVGELTAAGTAITLTAAHDVLLAEYSWVPGDNAQAIARVDREGQTEPVLARWAKLVGSLDEDIADVTRRKTRDLKELFG